VTMSIGAGDTTTCASPLRAATTATTTAAPTTRHAAGPRRTTYSRPITAMVGTNTSAMNGVPDTLKKCS
jgi:hypothetical protein